MVKRYDAEKNQLLSKSIDTSKPYAPIPVDDNHQIIGIVIAVAKPAK
jgi:SOS-response transcriptional repressor LexA